jgi:peptidoglycan/LPS O-acetylase OafA/YrhL
MRSFTDYLLEGYFLAPVIAFLIFSICRYGGVPSKILSMRTAVAGGTISYSLYLLQPFISPAFLRADPVPATITNFLTWFGNSTGFILLTLALSIVTYRLIEAPFRRLLRKRLGALLGGGQQRVELPKGNVETI